MDELHVLPAKHRQNQALLISSMIDLDPVDLNQRVVRVVGAHAPQENRKALLRSIVHGVRHLLRGPNRFSIS